MVTAVEQTEQTWRLLWSHAAYQVISAFPTDTRYEIVEAGYGWGVRNTLTQRALLIHPTGADREIGDLSLTVRGEGSQIIPRCGSDFISYLNQTSDIVETLIGSYIAE